MAIKVRIPTKELIIKRAKRAGYGLVFGGLASKIKEFAPKQSDLHKFARDKLKRPQYAGHAVIIPLGFVGSLMLGEEYENVAHDLAFMAGYETGDVIRREIDKEPVILLYTDKIHIERFNPNAEIRIFIDGTEYDANSFNTPATYGTVDTTNNKLITDGSGVFEASFKTPLTEGEHTVAVIDSQGKAYTIRVEL